MASSHRALLAISLILRLLTLIFLVASLAIIATAKIYDPYAGDDVVAPPYLTFQDYYAYRYVLSSGVIGCAYTLLVIPFLAINVARRKMAGGSEGGTMFLIFADLILTPVDEVVHEELYHPIKRWFPSWVVFANIAAMSSKLAERTSVFSVLIATGAAAGLGLAVEQQRYEKSFNSDLKKFFHSVDASCGLLLVATVCMVIMVMISVYSLTK